MQRFFSTLVSIALVLSALGFTQAGGRAAAPSASPSLQRKRAASAVIRFAPRQIKEANRKLRYTITAKYPQAVGADPRFDRLNHALRSMITEQVAGFKKDFQPPEERMGTMGSSFDTAYKVMLTTNDVVSIIFYIDSFYEGAAHPQHITLAFNYSFTTGKTMTLAELFKSNNYLNTISGYVIKALKKQIPEPDTDWIEKGAGPELDNYKSWNITRKGLLITFDPYQVASYAEGEHEVNIPYSALRNIIDPEGPLGKVAGLASNQRPLEEFKAVDGKRGDAGPPPNGTQTLPPQ